MSRLTFKPDPMVPPARLPPSLHAEYVRVVREWAESGKVWMVDDACDEVVRRVEARRATGITRLFE